MPFKVLIWTFAYEYFITLFLVFLYNVRKTPIQKSIYSVKEWAENRK